MFFVSTVFSSDKILYFYKNFISKIYTDSYLFIISFIIVIFCDSLIVDDEPIWEPIEWSVWQTLLVFIFMFAWTAEVLISSRFGNFTGRDKRIWLALFKAYWQVEFYLMLALVLLAIFGIVPFYFEQQSPAANWISFWLWYDKIFLWKTISYVFLILYFCNIWQISFRWTSLHTTQWFLIIVFLFTTIIVYQNILTLSFLYFTNPNTYSIMLGIDYSQLAHTPNKWAWGSASRDHFSYHTTPLAYWMKYEFVYISCLLFIHLFFTFSILLLYWQVIITLRKIYSTKQISYTYVTYICYSYRIYFYLISCMYSFSIISFIFILLRNPYDFLFY